MTQSFQDRFARADSETIGTDYLIPCGDVALFDGSVIPVDLDLQQTGVSPALENTTKKKTQVFYNAEAMDGPDYIVRGIWAHDDALLGERSLDELLTLATSDPSFTLLARASKDPMLVDLGRDQDPLCYDQAYGLRVTCPRSGAAPILKIVKLIPPAIEPGIRRPASTEEDGAQVLASVTLQASNLIRDPDWDETGNVPYRGFWQEMRLRVRRNEDRVILEAYMNDRNQSTPILTYTDQQVPLWDTVGLPGFEFLSATLTTQPSGASPFSLEGLPVMRCGSFQVWTIKDVRTPARVSPENFWTYNRIVDRVIALVEKNGDARYSATTAGQTKITTYLDFVLEAEAEIVRAVGYFQWLRRQAKVYLRDEVDTYELPENCGLVEIIRPNWNSVPLNEATLHEFHTRLAGVQQSGGKPQVFVFGEESVNNRRTIKVFPVPTVPLQNDEDPHFIIEYFARQIYPSEPDIQVPLVPQESIDVLIYGATRLALLLDVDDANADRFDTVFQQKMQSLKREVHRKYSTRQTVARSAADVFKPNVRSRIPTLRATQLETLLIF